MQNNEKKIQNEAKSAGINQVKPKNRDVIKTKQQQTYLL